MISFYLLFHKYFEKVYCFLFLQTAEHSVLSNINNAFLSKRRLVQKELQISRLQERLQVVEDKIWDLQVRMAEIDASEHDSSDGGKRRSIRLVS